ncbi:MAG: adenosylcobinamide-phosphate synthase CbiB [Ramlibacter sp.]|nr:adenosylcobinamide-phosphate synthase CbiB [Ramlibacter sp.]
MTDIAIANTALVALLVALCLDRWFGEPATRWHPVVWMGGYLRWAGEAVAPERAPAGGLRYQLPALLGGAAAWLVGAAGVGLAAFAIQRVAIEFAAGAAGLLLGVALKPLLAWRMLREETAAVEHGLAQSLESARAQLGRLVSRDVAALSETQVRESAIESLAENLNDSVVAPVFWFVLLGLPGAAVYRFANTADAMWGYRGRRGGREWEWAGKWAARADDVLSWLPARITALLLGAVAGGLPWCALRREAGRTPSPNSGWPMAAMALALGVCLGKRGVYALNGGGRAPQRADAQRAQVLAARAVLALVVFSIPVLMKWPSL